jgi:hypothetical protein
MRVMIPIAAVACAAPTHPAGPPPHAELVSHDELVTRVAARGATITRLPGGDALACNAYRCVCLAELHCDGECITLAHNLDGFTRALAGTEGRTVRCELADTGRLCDASYFQFDGDIYRFEDRYFDATGHLIGQRNATDFGEYCDGRANIRVMGAVPACREPARDVKVICGDRHRRPPLSDPFADLLDVLAP